MPAPIHVIVNPASAGGKGARLAPRVEAGLAARGAEFQTLRTESPGHAVALARRAAEAGAERVLAVGGDGTVHEVVNGLLAGGGGPALAVLPTGTGNDFYRMVGAPGEMEAALDIAVDGRLRPFDVGRARWEGGERHFVNLFGVGIDVELLRRREHFSRLPGLSQYLAALLAALVRYRPRPLVVEVDGERVREEPAMLAAVTVGPTIGGGFRIAPDARPDDGALDLCFVAAMGPLRVVRNVPKVIRGTHGDLPEVEIRRFTRGRVLDPQGIPFHFQFDGDPVPDTAVEIGLEVLPGALLVLTPGEGHASEADGGTDAS